MSDARSDPWQLEIISVAWKSLIHFLNYCNECRFAIFRMHLDRTWKILPDNRAIISHFNLLRLLPRCAVNDKCYLQMYWRFWQRSIEKLIVKDCLEHRRSAPRLAVRDSRLFLCTVLEKSKRQEQSIQDFLSRLERKSKQSAPLPLMKCK